MSEQLAMVQRARNAIRAGRYREALDGFRRLLAEAGESCPLYLEALIEAGMAARHCGRLDEALRLYRRAMAADVAAETMHALRNNEAIVQLDQARFAEADKAFESLLASEPAAAIDYVVNRSVVWMAMGRYAAVCSVLRHVLQLPQARSANVPHAMVRLSPAFAAMGHRRLAMVLARDGVRAKARHLPETHCAYHVARLHWAQTLARCGRYGAALDLLAASIPALIEMLGKTSLWVLRARLVKAESHIRLGHGGQARVALANVFDGLERYGASRPEAVQALRLQGELDVGRRSGDRAVARSWAMADKLGLANLHWERIACLRAAARSRLARGQHRPAARAWLEYARRMKELQGDRVSPGVLDETAEILARVGHADLLRTSVRSAHVAKPMRLLVVSDDLADRDALWGALPDGLRKALGRPRSVPLAPERIREQIQAMSVAEDLVVVVRAAEARRAPPSGVPEIIRQSCHRLRRWLAVSEQDLAVREAALHARWAWVIGRAEALPETADVPLLDPDQPDRAVKVLSAGSDWPGQVAADLATRWDGMNLAPLNSNG